MQRALITGSRGMIGKVLLANLQKRDFKVIEWNGDLVEEINYSEQFDVVFHLGAISSSIKFQSDPVKAFNINVTGTHRILNICAQFGARFIFTSSSSVYLPIQPMPIHEKGIIEPVGLYALSKRTAECLAMEYARERFLSGTILRLFNVYGEGGSPPFLIPYLLHCAYNNEVALLKHPNSKRDFVHVDDVVNALIAAAYRTEGSVMEIINIGTGIAKSIIDVANYISHVLHKPTLYKITNKTIPDTCPSMYADISNASKLLNWKPTVSFEKGIAQIIEKFSI